MHTKAASVILLLSLMAISYASNNPYDKALTNDHSYNKGKYISMNEGAYIPMDEGKYIPTNEGSYSRMTKENYNPAEGEYIPSKEEEYDDKDDGKYVPMDEGKYVPMNEGMYSYTNEGQYNSSDEGQYTLTNENDYNDYDGEYARNDEKYEDPLKKQEYNHDSAVGLNNEKYGLLNRAAFISEDINNGGYVAPNNNKYATSRDERKYASANEEKNNFTNRYKNLPDGKQYVSMNARQPHSTTTHPEKYDRLEKGNIPATINLLKNRQPTLNHKGELNMYGEKYTNLNQDRSTDSPVVERNYNSFQQMQYVPKNEQLFKADRVEEPAVKQRHVSMITERYGSINEYNQNIPAIQRYSSMNNGEYEDISRRYLPTAKILERDNTMNEQNPNNLSKNMDETKAEKEFDIGHKEGHGGMDKENTTLENSSATTTEKISLDGANDEEKPESMLNEEQKVTTKHQKKYEVNEICTPKSGHCDPFGRGTKPKEIIKQQGVY